MTFSSSKSQSDAMDSRLRGKDGGIFAHDDSIDGLWPSSPRTRGPTRSVFTLNVFPCIKKPIRLNGFPPARARRRNLRSRSPHATLLRRSGGMRRMSRAYHASREEGRSLSDGEERPNASMYLQQFAPFWNNSKLLARPTLQHPSGGQP